MSLVKTLSNCHDPKLVFHTRGGELDYLAYAHDVVLFAKPREALAIRLERLQAEIHEIGLSIKSAKALCTHILADGRRKATKLNSRQPSVSSNLIPFSSISSTWYILGIALIWNGKLPTTAVRDASRMLQERLRSSTFIRAIKLCADVLPTKSRRTKGRRSVSAQLTCRCGAAVESIFNLLKTCSVTREARWRRHNDIMCYTTNKLRVTGVSFLLEPHTSFANTYCKPDSIVFISNTVYIADTAICDPHRINTTIESKKEKYGSPVCVEQTIHKDGSNSSGV
ncbi:hypothetical protein P879_10013 [Paragonimus westermani]|uniref:Reverse transcriptase domain-containing protein n=1 Tax=Paragonimus westermani TaxID=34504 RepID=A0A8T0DKJ0_9TREM|nr:hypothetical protein P879_10013 [Paragonimus westermani]